MEVDDEKDVAVECTTGPWHLNCRETMSSRKKHLPGGSAQYRFLSRLSVPPGLHSGVSFGKSLI